VARLRFALIERAADLCEAVYRRLRSWGCVDPHPRHYALALLELNADRRAVLGGDFPIAIAREAFGYLVPQSER